MFKTEWLIQPLLIGLVMLPYLSTDLYLAALPQMGIDFQASNAAVQMTLTIFMFGYALSLLMGGPLSDFLGRKSVLCSSLVLYFLATGICLFSSSIITLNVGRFLQAIGSGSGMVIARVIVKDVYHKERQIHVMAHLFAAVASSSLLFPTIGGYLKTTLGWKSIFYVLGICSLILLFAVGNQIKKSEILPERFDFWKLLLSYKRLLQNRLFLGYSLAIGLVWVNLITFTLTAPFLLQNNLHFSSLEFGLTYSSAMCGSLMGALIARKLANRLDWNKLIFVGIVICLLGAVTMNLLVWKTPFSWISITLPMFFILLGGGMVIPCTQAAVMQPFPQMAGTASGLFFFIQMNFGGLAGLWVQAFSKISPLLLATTCLFSSLLLITIFYTVVWRKNRYI